MNKLLHIFTFSPVQGFISSSRRLSDLYHSSLLLSTITEKIIENLIKDSEVEVIYPILVEGGEGLANYPNRVVFLAKDCVCKEVVDKFHQVWKEVYQQILREVLDRSYIEIEQQAKLHLETYFRAYCECFTTEETKRWKEELKQNLREDFDDYAVAYDWTGRKLGTKKSQKPYEPLIDHYTYNGGKYPDGCTLCGERAHLAVDWERFRKSLRKDIRHYLKEGEKLCGVCLVKRFAFFYLGRRTFPSVHDIANAEFKEKLKKFEQKHKDLAEELRSLLEQYVGVEESRKHLWDYNAELFEIKELERIKKEDKDLELLIDDLVGKLRWIYSHQLLSPPSKNYYAIILSDGDSIGEWLGLKSRKRQEPLTEKFHREFSERLSEYAKKIRSLEKKDKFGLRIVYAGGDDVLAMADLKEFLDFAEKLNPLFKQSVRENASVSAGIVIGHQKDELSYLLREVRKAEKRAKSIKEKSAFCITVIPRGGAPVSFRAKWEFLKLLKDTISYFEKDIIGDRTAYDLRHIVSKFEDKSENVQVILALLKGMLKKRVNKSKLKEVLGENEQVFIENYLERLRSFLEASDFDIKNFANLFYVARFVAKERREKSYEVVGANT